MSKNSTNAADILKNSKNAGTEAGAENALNNTATETENAAGKGGAKIKETPLEFIARALEGKNASPFLAKLNVNLSTLKKEFASFKSEFCDKFTARKTPVAITATHAQQKWQELAVQADFTNFLLMNLEKFITPSNPNAVFARAELSSYASFCVERLNNIEKRPDAIGAYEALYGTKKESLKSENERLKARIAELEAKGKTA